MNCELAGCYGERKYRITSTGTIKKALEACESHTVQHIEFKKQDSRFRTVVVHINTGVEIDGTKTCEICGCLHDSVFDKDTALVVCSECKSGQVYKLMMDQS